MKLVVKRNRELAPINSQNTQNENRAEIIELIVPEEYESFNKKIVFITPNETVWDVIVNNQYKITNAITKYDKVDYYIWLTKEVDSESIDFRTKTKTLNFYHNVDASDEITDEEIHGVNTVVNLLEEEIEKVENLNIEATKIGDTTTVTITKKDGTTESVEINDGVDGQDGYTPQKGIDYFTEQDIEEIETDVKNDLEENVLVNYSLIAETGAKIELSINTTDYKLKAVLKDKNNNIIHTSNVIDLPLETMVVNATYDKVNKAIILTLQNGTTVSISVADLVAGLQTEITSSNKLASDLVDDTNSGNKFVTTSEKQTWNNKLDESDLADYVKNTDYATAQKGGVIKNANGLQISNGGTTFAYNYDYNTYLIKDAGLFIGKGTLENVIAGKQLINQTQLEESQETQDEEIEKLQTENARLKATLPTTTGEGQDITLNKTAELEFKKPPLPMGNSEQIQYSGRNLFNIETSTEDINCTKNNNIFVSNALNSYNVIRINLGANIELENGVDYYISYDIKTDSGDAKNFSYFGRLTDSNKYTSYGSLVGTFTMSNSYQRVIYKTTAEENIIATKLAMQVNSSITNAQSVSIKNIQISTSNLDYEPYVGGQASPNPDYPQEITNVTGDVEVVVENKNLYNENKVTVGKMIYADGTILSSSGYNLTDYIDIHDFNKFTISAVVDSGSFNICYFDNDKNVTSGGGNGLTGTTLNEGRTFTKPNNAYYVRFHVKEEWTNIMLEGTETKSTYVTHKEQTFTFPLGNEKLMLGDYLADDGKHHVRGQRIFDGTENWQDADSSSVGYSKKFLEIINEFKMRTEIICTHFKNLTTIADVNNTSIIGKAGISYWGNNHIYFGIEKQTTEEWKAFLAEQYQNGTPVIAEYKLAEEVIVPYTSAQQEVYNQIKQALSYEEQTNISSNTIALFNVEAYQSTKLVLEEMATAIVALGGV